MPFERELLLLHCKAALCVQDYILCNFVNMTVERPFIDSDEALARWCATARRFSKAEACVCARSLVDDNVLFALALSEDTKQSDAQVCTKSVRISMS